MLKNLLELVMGAMYVLGVMSLVLLPYHLYTDKYHEGTMLLLTTSVLLLILLRGSSTGTPT